MPALMVHCPDSASSHRQTSHRPLAFPATIQLATIYPTTSTSPLSDTIPLPTSRHPSRPSPLADFIRSPSIRRPICPPTQHTFRRRRDILCRRHSIRSHGFIASTGKVRTAAQLHSAVANPPMSRRPPSGDTFDPRYVVPTQARGGPVRPPPGPGHNGGPPLRPGSTSRIPTQPSRAAPTQASPTAPQPPDNSAAAAGAAAAGAAATDRLNEPPPGDPEAAEKLEAWQRIMRVRGEEAPEGQYLGPGGRNTSAGVRLNPKLPEPAAGWGYRPAWRHLRDGYRGELQLANRIVAALPNETVIHYGMPAGRQGPDVISISRDGTISVWDSKWRSGQRTISAGQRAHQSEKSLKALYWVILNQVRMAIRSGHLPSDVGALAMKNIIARNFDIYTIGTGNAHSGVAQSIRNGIPTDTRRP